MFIGFINNDRIKLKQYALCEFGLNSNINVTAGSC